MSHVADPPAGKREQTKLANRQAILDAAREVFADLGYEAATVRDIIGRTGLASGTFYNYFRCKEELRTALAAEGARRFAPMLKALRASAPDFESFVRAAIGAYFEVLADEHQNWRARRPPDELRTRVLGETPETAAIFAEVRDALQSALSGRDGPVADPDYMAAACIAVAREVGHTMLLRRPIDTTGATDFTVAMILGGLKALPAGR